MNYAVALLALLAACTQPRWLPSELPVDVVVVGDVTDVQLEAVLDGARKWNDATGIEVFRVTYAPDAVERCGAIYVSSGDLGSVTAGRTYYSSPCKVIVILSEENDDQETEYAATHELGHTLGFEHSADPLDVMFPYYTDRGVVTKGEADEVRDRYGR